jgi:hypothetical protein
MTDDVPHDPLQSPALPSERARIEPTAPATKLDALPILYVVGFLILASALIYVWRHPTLPQGVAQQATRVDTLRQDADTRAQEMAALAARLSQLEARPVPQAADLAPLDARLKALEAKPAPAMPDLRPVETRLTTLEARPLPPPPVNLGPLEDRLAAVEARRPVDLSPLEGKVSALEKRQADMQAALGKFDTLDSRLSAAEAQGRQTAAGLSSITDRAQRSQRLIAATASLEAGQRLGDIPGAPPALAKFAHDAPPTDAALRLSFNQAAEAAHRASQPAITDNQPLLDRMWTRAQQSVTVRQGERVLVGDPIAGVIAGARQALDAGDLAGSVKALDGLSGPARAAMADWIGRARSLLDARAALAEMAAR